MSNKGQYNFRKPIDKTPAEYERQDLDLETVQRPALDRLYREVQYKGSTKRMLLVIGAYLVLFIGLVFYVIYLIKK